MEEEDKAFGETYLKDFEENFSRFTELISDTVAESLRSEGFAIIDGFLGDGWASAILQEMKWLARNNLFNPNKTHFTIQGGKIIEFSKPNISEIDLHDEGLRLKVPLLNNLFYQTNLVEALDSMLQEFMLKVGHMHHTLKLQHNSGNGGCFPLHYDNPGAPNKRKLTCILYLNPEWKDGDGGEVQLIPFLDEPINIAPRMDRLVIFSSDRILHRVLPSHAERFCLTIWLDGAATNIPEDVQLRVSARSVEENWSAVVEYFKASPVQRLLSRGVYEEEYELSLRECMESAEGFEELMLMHQNHIDAIKKNPALCALVEKLRTEKYTPPSP